MPQASLMEGIFELRSPFQVYVKLTAETNYDILDCQSNPEQKEYSWRYPYTWLKLYCRVFIMKQHCIGTENRHIGQDKRIGDPISLHSFSHLSFEKDAKVHIGEKIAPSTIDSRKIGSLLYENETRPFPHPS